MFGEKELIFYFLIVGRKLLNMVEGRGRAKCREKKNLKISWIGCYWGRRKGEMKDIKD